MSTQEIVEMKVSVHNSEPETAATRDPDRERDIEHLRRKIAHAMTTLTADYVDRDEVVPLELRALRAVRVLAEANAEFYRLFPPKAKDVA